MEEVEEMVDQGLFSSKSEFQRFAVEFVLSEMGSYEPEMVNFEELKMEAFEGGQPMQNSVATPDDTESYYENAARVKQFAIRGDITIAEEYIDTTYPVTDPRCLLLDDLLASYRTLEESD